MSFCGDSEPAPALTEQRSSLASLFLQRRLIKNKMRTRCFLILPEEKESKGTWETPSSFDVLIDFVAVICVFEVGARYTFVYVELNLHHFY